MDLLGAAGPSCHGHLGKSHGAAPRCLLVPAFDGRSACVPLGLFLQSLSFSEVCILCLPFPETLWGSMCTKQGGIQISRQEGPSEALLSFPLREKTRRERMSSVARVSGVVMAHHSCSPRSASNAFACCSLPWFVIYHVSPNTSLR